MPVKTAFIAAAKPVAHRAVPYRIECGCTFKNLLSQQVMMFEQHPPYFVQRRSRSSWYRRHCSRRVWSASCVGTPFFSALGIASTAAWRCISAGAPPRLSTRFRVRFLPLFVTRHERVSWVCPPSSFSLNTVSLFVSVCFLLVLYARILVQRNEYSYCCCCRGKHTSCVSSTAGKNAAVQLLPWIDYLYTLLELRRYTTGMLVLPTFPAVLLYRSAVVHVYWRGGPVWYSIYDTSTTLFRNGVVLYHTRIYEFCSKMFNEQAM